MQLRLVSSQGMLGKDYTGQNCSIARALEVVGERWTMLILRDVFLGVRRFDDIQEDLGVARNVLATRLDGLVSNGILEKVPYQERPVRHEYRLTGKGRDLWPALAELMQWGDRYAPAPGGSPTVVRHRDCGGVVGERQTCERCGRAVELDDVVAEPGPGATANHPLRRRREGAVRAGV
jgi:DNA-binding HxlR family transcriptional regulator